jgi:hypothetical protein
MQNRNEDRQYFGQDLKTTTKHNTAKHLNWSDLLWQMSGHIMADKYFTISACNTCTKMSLNSKDIKHL